MTAENKDADVELTANQFVDRDCVVWVQHAGHRKPHAAVVFQGQALPLCSVCGSQVRYQVIAESLRKWGLDYLSEDPDFIRIES